MVNGKPRTHNLFTLSIPCRKFIYTVSGLNNKNTRQNPTVHTISAPPYILMHEPSLAKIIGFYTSDTNTVRKNSSVTSYLNFPLKGILLPFRAVLACA